MIKKSLKNLKPRVKTLAWSFFEIGETLVISLATVLIVRAFIAQPFLVSGGSMEPIFWNGDYLLIDEVTYRLREPSRGEVVVFRYPGNPRSYYIKRIIGLPSEEIVIDKGVISVYKDKERTVIKENYVTPTWTFGHFETELKDNEYFVMGDNRNFSFDSRSWGPLQKEALIGVVRFRLWPINKVMAFTAPNY